jgi:FixJ family two-component response regulator
MGGTRTLLPHFYIVDDDRSFGRSLQRLLKARRLSADYFESARSFFDSIPPDRDGCAIVDLRMPECDGFSMIDKMHELHYDMRCIVITGHAQNDAKDIALQKGALGLLQKPFSEASFWELLHRADC